MSGCSKWIWPNSPRCRLRISLKWLLPVPASPAPRRVRFEHENDVDPVRMFVRTSADPPVLAPGAPIEVEVGARWQTTEGVTERVPGHWVPCVVVRDTPRELVVRLA